MSGGLDSTLMASVYLRWLQRNAEKISRPVQIYVVSGCNGTKLQPHNHRVSKIVDTFKFWFQHALSKTVIWDPEGIHYYDTGAGDQKGAMAWEFRRKFMMANGIDAHFCGQTRNVPDDILEIFDLRKGEYDLARSPNKPCKSSIWQDVAGDNYYPWINVDKRLIAAGYEGKWGTDVDEIRLKTLKDLTLSCVAGRETPCKQCYWCKEKRWAFGHY